MEPTQKMQEIRIVDSIQQIRHMAGELHLMASTKIKIVLQLDNIPEDDRIRAENIISQHYASCGCQQGRISGMVTFGVYCVLMILGIVSISELGIWKTLWYYLLFAFAGMLIGKVIGIIHGKIALRNLANNLEKKQLLFSNLKN